MNTAPEKREPTGKEIRAALMRRANAYCEANGITLTDLSRVMHRGKGFFREIEDGTRNFTMRTYDECMGWFDKNSGSHETIGPRSLAAP